MPNTSFREFKNRADQALQSGEIDAATHRALIAEKMREGPSRRADQIARVQAGISNERSAQASGFGRRLAGQAGATGLHAVNAATLGYMPRIAGAIGGEESQSKLEDALEISSQTNPIASTVGGFGGMFAGPAGAAAKYGSRALTGLTRSSKLAAAASESPFLARAAAHTINNLVGGAGAITATQLAMQRDDDAGIGQRLHDAVEMASSPTSIGLSVLAGAATAKFTPSLDRELKTIIQKFERSTGEKVPIDVLANSKSLSDFMDAAARNPTTVRAVERVRARMTRGLKDQIVEMRRGLEPTGYARTDARRARRAASGARRIQGALDKEAAATRARKGPQGLAIEAEGQNVLDAATKQGLMAGLSSILRDNLQKGREPIGGFDDIVKETQRLINTPGANVYQLEALRKSVANLGWAGKNRLNPQDPRNSDKARLMAKEFYNVIMLGMDSAGPSFASAVRGGEQFRRMEDALKSEKVQHINDAVMENFFAQAGLLGKNGRLAQLKQFAPVKERQAAAGWLVGRLIGEVVDDATGLVNRKKLNSLSRKTGMFNRQILDEVAPGVFRELDDLARLSDKMKLGIYKAPGSDTAIRGAIISRQVALPLAIVATVNSMVLNPYHTAASVLGAAGLAALFTTIRRSFIGGRLGNTMSALATSGPQGLSRLPAAASETAQQLGLERMSTSALRMAGSGGSQ